MKKLTTILLSVLLIASLFVSCDNTTKAVQDELVEVTLSTQAESRSLTVSNPLEALSSVAWTYKATKVTERQFNYGEKDTETSIILYPGEGQSKQILTLSQGKWKFELFGRSKDENKTLLYHGKTDEVLILKSSGLNQITVEVSPYTDALGQISFNGVKLVKANGDQFTPNYLYVTGPNGYVIPEADKSFNGTKNLTGLNAGQYTVTVAWKETMTGDNPYTEAVEPSYDVVIASETIVVTVYGGRTTTISGNISEETGSGTINGNIEIKTEATQQKTVVAGTPTTFTVNVAPANSEYLNKVENTTVTFAENKLSGSTAKLDVIVKDISTSILDSSFTVDDESSAVAGISLLLRVNDEPVSGEFGTAVIETYIAKGLTNVQVKYNGTDEEQPDEITTTTSSASSSCTTNYYESDTGKLVFSTTHFSEYYVISDSVDVLNVTTNTAYATLKDAIGAVPSNADNITNIKVLRDVTNAGGMSVASGKNFVVDFNNHTYTIVGPGAGSTNTETSGFQFLRNSTITLKNGKIDYSKDNTTVLRLIQNYANLTLEDLEIDATNQYYYKGYVIAFCCGTNRIIGNTSIYSNASSFNPDGTTIFDVADWDDGGYHGVNLTIDTTGDIRGVVEVDLAKPGDNCGSYFKLTNGNVNKVSITGGVINNLNEINCNNISITGGQFSTNPSEYLAEYYTADANEGNTSWTVRKMTNEELAADGYVARYSDTNYYKKLSDGFANHSSLHLINDASEDITRNGMVDLYCDDDHSFIGSISCPGKTLYINNGTATLNRIECKDFYGGFSNYNATVIVKDGSAANIKVAKNANVTIEGGTYTGTIKLTAGGTGSLTITGGTFSTDPSDYLAYGKMAVLSDGIYRVLDDTRVKTEEQLKSAVENGGEITLGADIQLTEPLYISKNVTLNLGEYKITGKDKSYAIVLSTENDPVKVIVNATTGGVIGTGSNGDCFVMSNFNNYSSELTVNDGAYSSDGYFVNINAGSSTPENRKDKLTINGGTYSGKRIINANPANTEIVMTGGFLTGTDTSGGINFGKNSTNSTFTMTGGSITHNSDSVITGQASGNTINISGTADVTGKLSLKNSTMNITGGSVNIKGNNTDNKALMISTGSTLNISGDAKVKGNPLFNMNGGTVNITGGSFSGKIVNGLNYGNSYLQSVEDILTEDYQLSGPDGDGWYQVNFTN